jgi:hypothetical protein
MRTYFALFLAVWLVYAPAVCWALPSHLFFRRAPDTPVVSYIINEDFEGTGRPPVWVDGSTPPNWDNTTNAIDGQSPSFSSTSANAYYPITDGTFFVVVLRFKMPTSLPASNRIITAFREGAGTNHCSADVTTTGQLRLSTNGSTFTTTDTMAVNTNYYIKLIYNEGGSSSAEFSTTSAFVGSGTKYRSGTSASGVTTDRFYIGYPSNSIVGHVVDDVKLATADFSL